MDHAREETLSNGFSSGLGLKIFIENISPGTLDSILLSILLGDESVLEPLLGPISSNPLDSSFALIVILFWISLVQLIEIWWQILRCIPTALSATLPC